MSARLVALAIFLAACVPSASAQLPAPQKLSAADYREFNQELERLRALLSTANDKCAVELQIANTYAAGGQYQEAIRRLRKVVDADFGFDPSRDQDFAKIRNSVEFQSIVEEARRQTPPVLHSRLITTFDERDLFPENLAFDPGRNDFFLGSIAKDAIVKCPAGAACVPFVTNSREGYVLGLKIDQRSGAVWATGNTSTEASLRRYDLETGKLQQTASMKGKHVFNDLALSSAGFVYVTDTSEGSVYQLDIRNNTWRRIAPGRTFTAANGIALSPDEKVLYVSAWGDGLEVIDLGSELVRPMLHANNVCLAFIDGLYATERSLVAIQNGPMQPRIVQFMLSRSGREITGILTLGRRDPAFDGITTGALVGNDLYYVANPQMDKKDSGSAGPLQVYSVQVAP